VCLILLFVLANFCLFSIDMFALPLIQLNFSTSAQYSGCSLAFCVLFETTLYFLVLLQSYCNKFIN